MARRSRPQQEKPSPDRGLADENYAELNATFYGMKPHIYLRRRLRSLWLWHGDPPGLAEILGEKFIVDGMAVTLGTEGDDEAEKRERERFVVIEAEVLLHHVSETLLRLYLVHAKESSCPWLDVSREKSFGRLKKDIQRLRKRLETGEEKRGIENAFLPPGDRAVMLPDHGEEVWEQAVQNLSEYLDYYAAHFLDAAPYNAAKHGLALLAGQSGIELGASGDSLPFLKRSGPALVYLDIERDERTGDPRWAKVTKWIVLRRALAMTHMGCRLIEEVWKIGTGHRTSEEPVDLHLFTDPRCAEVLRSTEHEVQGGIPGVTTDRVSERLLYR
jgi:hypothetical protein